MSQELFLMRHGETLFNQLHRIQGSSDSPLTQKGIADAKIVSAYFKKQGLIFDHAYASTQERACDTLELVTKQSYQRMKEIKEWNFGVFEGQSDTLNPPISQTTHSYADFFVPFGGESDLEVQKRMIDALTKIMQRPQHQRVLVVSHAGAIFMFLRKWISWQDAQKVKFNNCAILKFTYENQVFHFDRALNLIN